MYNTNNNKKYFIPCPRCGCKTIPVHRDTKLIRFPLYCKKCHNESVVDFEIDGERQRLRASAD